MLELAKRAICVKARQIGWSHTTAGAAVLWSAFHGEHTTILSRGEKESLEVLDKARRHVAVLQALGSKWVTPIKSTHQEIVFASGGRILALPSTGGRGFTGNLILDEYAYFLHAEGAWDSAVPATRLGDFKLRVISTPNGLGNAFAELVETILSGDMPRTRLHEVTIEDAERDGFPVDWAECWEDAKGDPRLFDQLYRCKFLDGEQQYIPAALLQVAFDGHTEPDGGFNYGGLDIGETRDRTSMGIVNRNGEERRLVHLESHKLTDDDLIDKLVAEAFDVYGCKRVAVDATGLGTFPAKRLRKRYGRRVEPVKFTANVKEDLATGLYDVLRTEDLKLPRSYRPSGDSEDYIPQLRDAIYKIRRTVTSAGNVRFDAQRTVKGHADEAWALMLALHAAGQMSSMTAALQRAKAN